MDNLLMAALALLFFAIAVWLQRHAPAEPKGVVGVGQAVTHKLPDVNEKPLNFECWWRGF